MGSIQQNDITNSLLSTVQIMADSSAQAKEATLVVEAEVVEIIDEGLGTYTVNYLGNKFEATTAHTEIKYKEGDMVYIVVPNGDFDKNKVILSPVTPSEAKYSSVEDGDSHVTIGENLFAYVPDVSLCSYKPHSLEDPSSVVLPNPNHPEYISGFGDLFQAALSDSRTFNFTCKIKTTLDKARRSKGNYGLALDIPVIQLIDGEQIKKYYNVIIDVNNITGDPYNLSVPALQNFYFTLPDDMEYNNSISPRIRSFIVGFIGESNSKPDDIFITEIKLLSTLEIKQEDLSGYYSVITASEGTSFLKNRTDDVKTLSVTAYLNGKKTAIENFDCYWFRENVTVDTSSDEYQHFGGLGWEILNKVSQKNVAEDGKVNYQYVTNVYTQIVKQNDIHCDMKYKCVLVKGDTVINSTIIIKNLASTAKLELTTADGFTLFPVGVGDVELQLKYYEQGVTDTTLPPNVTVNYAWQRLDKKGNFINSDFYVMDEFNTKENDSFYTKIHYSVSTIDEVNTIVCTAYMEQPVSTGFDDEGNPTGYVHKFIIGTVRLTVSTGEIAATRLVLSNGDKLYKYDADGDSPMVADYDGPLTSAIKSIDPIGVKIFKEDGSEFTENEYKTVIINWLVPINSMIKLTTAQKGDTNSNPGYYTISGKYPKNKELSYQIEAIYNKNKIDNTVIVQASAPKAVLKNTISTTANIRFLKDGESGTNGTKYSAILTYGGYGYGEKDVNGKIHKLQLVYAADKNDWYISDLAAGTYKAFSNQTLAVKLYSDGELVNTSPAPTVTWSIFDNGHVYSSSDANIIKSPIKIASNTGEISKNGNKWTTLTDNFCATIEAKVIAINRSTLGTTIDTKTLTSKTNSEEYVYAYYPIECSYVKKLSYLNGCLPSLEGGFSRVLYASDGTNPQYDNSKNFYTIDGLYKNDLDNLYDYVWSASSNLKTLNTSKTDPTCKVAPTSKYDNSVANNFVRVQLWQSSDRQTAIKENIKKLQGTYVDNTVLYNYYSDLQKSLKDKKIFEQFKYSEYINQLTRVSNFYLLKQNLTKVLVDLLAEVEKIEKHYDFIFSLDGRKYNPIELSVYAFLKGNGDEKKSLKNKLKNLWNLCAKLGTKENITKQITESYPPGVLIIPNTDPKNYVASYTTGTEVGLFSISANNDILSYNKMVESTYTKLYNSLSETVVINAEKAVENIVKALYNFTNDPALINLASTYTYTITPYASSKPEEKTCNKEAYRYKALIANLQKYVQSLSNTEAKTDSYNSVVKKVLDSMYKDLKWYIDFEKKGGYSSQVSGYQKTINETINAIDSLRNKLLLANTVEIVHVKPVIMTYNRYEFSHINGWDGNKLEIGKNNEYMIAPQVGAGKKDTNNTFTGVIIGVKQVKAKTSPSITSQQIGLFGFSKGAQSLFLDAEKGSATFGTEGAGQIIINPQANNAIIKSGNYSTSTTITYKEVDVPFGSNPQKQGLYEKNSSGKYVLTEDTTVDDLTKKYYTLLQASGMQINLSAPEIRFGSGNFVVNSKGHITAKGGGSIANWNINDTQIYKGSSTSKITIDAGTIHNEGEKDEYTSFGIYSGTHDKISATTRGFYLSYNGLSISDADNNNRIELSTTGNPKIYSGGHSTLDSPVKGFYLSNDGLSISDTSNNNRIELSTTGNPKIYSGGHSTLGKTNKGFYLSNDGLSIGNNIRITNDVYYEQVKNVNTGKTNPDNPYAEGWYIYDEESKTYKKATKNDTKASSEKKYYIQYSDGCVIVGKVNQSKKWIICGDSSIGAYIGYNTTKINHRNNSVYIGVNGISLGKDKFTVTDNGELTSKSGHIGGWSIDANKLSTNGITISSEGDGSIVGNNWSIYEASATFEKITANVEGNIGGWTIDHSTLKASQLTLDGSGTITGPGFKLSSGGLTVGAGGGHSIDFGGTGWTTSGFSGGGSALYCSTKDNPFGEHSDTNGCTKQIRTLSVDAFEAKYVKAGKIKTTYIDVKGILNIDDGGWANISKINSNGGIKTTSLTLIEGTGTRNVGDAINSILGDHDVTGTVKDSMGGTCTIDLKVNI